MNASRIFENIFVKSDILLRLFNPWQYKYDVPDYIHRLQTPMHCAPVHMVTVYLLDYHFRSAKKLTEVWRRAFNGMVNGIRRM
jgi:hypothetical protein